MQKEFQVLDDGTMCENGLLERGAKKDAKRFKTQMTALGAIVVVFVLLAPPLVINYIQKRQSDAFLEGKTLWCKHGDILVSVSKNTGYSYDGEINAFISMQNGFAIPNSEDRCRWEE